MKIRDKMENTLNISQNTLNILVSSSIKDCLIDLSVFFKNEKTSGNTIYTFTFRLINCKYFQNYHGKFYLFRYTLYREYIFMKIRNFK